MAVDKKKKDPVFLDFEFYNVVERKVTLVSCVTYIERTNEIKRWWLHKSESTQKSLRKYLREHELIVGYACVAEGRSFISLGMNPVKHNWIDLFLEYRLLTNHYDEFQWGKQLVDGKVRTFRKPPPKYQRTEEDNTKGFKATHSLAEATYKLTGEIRDTEEKDEVRDIIISGDVAKIEKNKNRILNYNQEDVVFLPKLWRATKEAYKKFVNDPNVDIKTYFKEAMLRGKYSALTAIMESRGYPIDVESTRNFSKQIDSILSKCQRDINRQFPDIMPFRWIKKDNRFAWNQKVARDWLRANVDTKSWMKTKKSKTHPSGQISLSLEAWERVFQFKHSYPEYNFGAQMVRFLKLKQSLYGFSEPKNKSSSFKRKKTFWDHVGSDGRVRPYMNIFGAQSGRSQPAATGFMFLKPAWMRSLVIPKPGRFMAGVDYGQQEFFLAGLVSGDETMIAAYLSGDPYMYGAKLAGAIPQDGTKEEYSNERDLFKNTYLGILFGMTKIGLSHKLTGDMGREFTQEEAQQQIMLFEQTFPRYVEWRAETLAEYQSGVGIELPCGWKVGPDNDNPRSVLNVPIQGRGASIMRKAVELAEERGCKNIFTLHDALYIEGTVGNEEDIVVLMDCMTEAFQWYFKGTEYYEVARSIKLDPSAWSPDYADIEPDEKGRRFIEVGGKTIPVSELYLDKRAKKEYETFSKYFSKPDSDYL